MERGGLEEFEEFDDNQNILQNPLIRALLQNPSVQSGMTNPRFLILLFESNHSHSQKI